MRTPPPIKKEYIPCSFIANIIIDFVESKRAEGLSYTSEYMVLKSFDRYLIAEHISSVEQITVEQIARWNEQSSKANKHKDCRYAIRGLLIYMKTKLNMAVTIPPRSYKESRKQPHVFESVMHEQIEEFIKFKHGNGFKYESEEGILLLFDKMCIESGASSLSKDLVVAWSKQRDCESRIYTCKRISIIRQFADFLIGQGYEAYRAPEYPMPKSVPPHIFSEEELISIFKEADEYCYRDWGMKLSLPVILRFYYGMGLRLNEALHLTCSDVELDTGCIHIKAAKNFRDRDVYMSPDLMYIANIYNSRIKERLAERTMFFICDVTGRPIRGETVCGIFNKLWIRTGYKEMQDKKPTIHSFRHTFVVRKMEEWYREKVDFSYYMPYLSAFLGHQSLKETYYYVHFVDSSFPDIRNAMSSFEHLYPEARS